VKVKVPPAVVGEVEETVFETVWLEYQRSVDPEPVRGFVTLQD